MNTYELLHPRTDGRPIEDPPRRGSAVQAGTASARADTSSHAGFDHRDDSSSHTGEHDLRRDAHREAPAHPSHAADPERPIEPAASDASAASSVDDTVDTSTLAEGAPVAAEPEPARPRIRKADSPYKGMTFAELGRIGGKKGGPIRAANMTPEERSAAARKASAARLAKTTPEQRSEIARRAAQARWKKP